MQKIILVIFFFLSIFLIENYYSNTIESISIREQAQEQYYMSSYDYSYDFIHVDSIEEYEAINKEDAIVANPLNQGESTVYYQLISGDYESEVVAQNPIEITQNINNYVSEYAINISSYNQLNYDPLFGDNTYLDVYNKDLVAGRLSSNTSEIVIDTLSAQLYFDTSNYEEVIGKNIELAYFNVTDNKEDNYNLEIVGVYQYEPYNDTNFYVYNNPLILQDSQTSYNYEDFDEKFVSYNPTFLIELPVWETYAYQQEFLSQFDENFPFQNAIIYPANSGISNVETVSENEVYPNAWMITIVIGFIQFIVAMVILFVINYKIVKNKIYYLIQLILLIPLLVIFSYAYITSLNYELVPISIFSYIYAFIPFIAVGIVFSIFYYKKK